MTDRSCIFCRIVAGEVPAPKIYEDANFICIRDVQPQARKHLLILPKEHLPSLVDVLPAQGPSREELIGSLYGVAVQVARSEGLLPGGFRTVINTLRDAGQSVEHLHLHLLGGEPLRGTFGA